MTTPHARLTVRDLDALPEPEAGELLENCCGAQVWVRGMLQRRPFGSLGTVLSAAAEVWWSLAPSDWLEAFSHHPRIGEQGSAAPSGARARGWSTAEQGAVSAAGDDVRDALAEGNREYERRFGHIYIVSATGKTADEMLEILYGRLSNDAETELKVAAGEQAKITELRLRKLLEPDTASPTSAP